jgi:exonuclease III
MKIATFNVNGVNGRLPVLLRWLRETRPDVVCLQELKAPQDKFPEGALRDAGYGSIWNGQRNWRQSIQRAWFTDAVLVVVSASGALSAPTSAT